MRILIWGSIYLSAYLQLTSPGRVTLTSPQDRRLKVFTTKITKLALPLFRCFLGKVAIYYTIELPVNPIFFRCLVGGWWWFSKGKNSKRPKEFFIFSPTWGNDPIWLVFFRWVETTKYFLSLLFIGFFGEGEFFLSFFVWTESAAWIFLKPLLPLKSFLDLKRGRLILRKHPDDDPSAVLFGEIHHQLWGSVASHKLHWFFGGFFTPHHSPLFNNDRLRGPPCKVGHLVLGPRRDGCFVVGSKFPRSSPHWQADPCRAHGDHDQRHGGEGMDFFSAQIF